jgi:hypothetical protein
MNKLIPFLSAFLTGCSMGARVDPPITSTVCPAPVPMPAERVTQRTVTTTRVAAVAPGFSNDIDNPIPVRPLEK